jgi:hypothetical protein
VKNIFIHVSSGFPFRTRLLFLFGWGIALSVTAPVDGDEYQISLTNGSVITAEVSRESLAWTKVLASGEMSQQSLKFSDIERLVLSDSPASEQVANIRRLLNRLAGDDYLARQKAESELSSPEIGGNFKTMIKTEASHESFEVRYRIERILKGLESDEADSTASEFDQITLKNGTKIEGDAGEFRLECTYRGRKMSLARADVRLLAAPAQPVAPVQENKDVEVRMFHSFDKEFYLPTQTTVDFELSPNGSEIKHYSNVNELFTNVGLKLGTEQQGYIGTSNYGFKFANKPAKGNSVCVFETVGTWAKKFKGVMEIEFCMPNQKSVSAGVHEIGFLIARVNHSRDFIVEAYNADGQILACVESTDEPCVFAGVKSTEPIAKLRILSNPFLFRIDRGIDEDFAVDSICFSTPIPIAAGVSDKRPTIRLKNGDLVKGGEIEMIDASTVSIDVANNKFTKIGMDEIHSLHFGRETEPKSKVREWLAMLPDRSTVFVQPGTPFVSQTFPDLSFEANELMGFWSAGNQARFPEASDFKTGKNVLVFPTCRIASDSIVFSESGFKWDPQAAKLQQPLEVEGDERDDEDPTPTIHAIEYEESWPESIPTIWMNPPSAREPGAGSVRLTDGQQLVIGNEARFQFVRIDKTGVTIAVDGQETSLPLEEVVSIEFPQDD